MGGFAGSLHRRRRGVSTTGRSCGVYRGRLGNVRGSVRTTLRGATRVGNGVSRVESNNTTFRRTTLGGSNRVSILRTAVTRGGRATLHFGSSVSLTTGNGTSVSRNVTRGRTLVRGYRDRSILGGRRLRRATSGVRRLVDSGRRFSELSTRLGGAVTSLAIGLSSFEMGTARTGSDVRRVGTERSAISRDVGSTRTTLTTRGSGGRGGSTTLIRLSRGVTRGSGSITNFKLERGNGIRGTRRLGRGLRGLSERLSRGRSGTEVLSSLRGGVRNCSNTMGTIVHHTERGTLNNVRNPLSRLVRISGRCSATIRITLNTTVRGVMASARTSTGETVCCLGRGGINETAFLPVSGVGNHALRRHKLSSGLNFITITDRLIRYSTRCGRVITDFLTEITIISSVSDTVNVTGGCGGHFGVIALSKRMVGPNNSVANNDHTENTNVLSHTGVVRRLRTRTGGVGTSCSRYSTRCGLTTRRTGETTTRVRTTRTRLVATGRSGVHARNRNQLVTNEVSTLGSRLTTFTGRGRGTGNEVGLFRRTCGRGRNGASRVHARVSTTRGHLRRISNSTGNILRRERTLETRARGVGLRVLALTGSSRTTGLSVRRLQLRGSARSNEIGSVRSSVGRVRTGGTTLVTSIRDVGGRTRRLERGSTRSKRRVSRLVRREGGLSGHSTRLHALRQGGKRRHRGLSTRVMELSRHGVTVHGRCSRLGSVLFRRCRLAHHRTRTLGVRVRGVRRTGGHLRRVGITVGGLNSVGINTVRRCGRISRECRFLGRRASSVRGSGSRLGGVVRSLATSVDRGFVTRFGEVGTRFGAYFTSFFNNNGNRVLLSSPDGYLRDRVRVGVRPPKGSIRGVGLFSNNRGSLTTVTLLFDILGIAPSPFYVCSRIRTTLSSIGIRHFTGCVHQVASGARFVSVAREHNAVRRTSILCNMAVRRGNISGLLRLRSTRLTTGVNLRWVLLELFGKRVVKLFSGFEGKLGGAHRRKVATRVRRTIRSCRRVASRLCSRLRRVLVVNSINFPATRGIVGDLGRGIRGSSIRSIGGIHRVLGSVISNVI